MFDNIRLSEKHLVFTLIIFSETTKSQQRWTHNTDRAIAIAPYSNLSFKSYRGDNLF